MNLLAFDTACDACSVAVWDDGQIVAHRAKAMVRGQSEELVSMIDQTMRQSGASFAALSAVAVTIGPGAFTGLRIGLATARAIALAAGCRAIGVSTFDAIAAAAAIEHRDRKRGLVVAIDTKRGDLYLQSYLPDDTSALGFTLWQDATVLTPQAALAILPPGPLLLAGDGARCLQEAMGSDGAHAIVAQVTLPDAAHVAALAARRFAVNPSSPILRPLYLRPPAVRLPQTLQAGTLS